MRKITRFFAIAVLPVLIVASLPILLGGGSTASAGHLPSPAPVVLGTAGGFSVLAGSAITNVGVTTIDGDVGIHPNNAVVGFDPCPAATCVVLNGDLHVADNVAKVAKVDLDDAYSDAASRTVHHTIATDLIGQTLDPGVYDSLSGTFANTGTVTLDAGGDPNAIFIFKMTAALNTAAASIVALTGSADACNVFWQVGTDATLGGVSTFKGTILAAGAITAGNGADVEGRTLARSAAVTFDTNTIGGCAAAAAAPGSITLAKTHQYRGSPAVRSQGKWVFTLRRDGVALSCTNPNPARPGKCTTNLNGNAHKLHYRALPAGTYTLCEKPFADWRTRYANRPGGSTVQGRCMTFALAAGQRLTGGDTIKVNNVCPRRR